MGGTIKEQKMKRQFKALPEAEVPQNRIYMDYIYQEKILNGHNIRNFKKLNKDSVLYVKSINRLGRNYGDLNEQWRIITKEKHADIVVLDVPILDTRKEKNLMGTLISDIVLALLSYVAENERVNIRQRQAEGIASAKARGVKFDTKTDCERMPFGGEYVLYEGAKV